MYKVKLIGVTQPAESTGCNSAEELVAYCARVSNPKNQANHTTGPKLIRHLLENGHWSPLEMVSVNIEINTTRDIARQILRHRSFSFQEFSQRYAEVATFTEPREARLQDKKNRQNSIQTEDEQLKLEWLQRQKDLILAAEENYSWAINAGIAKEVARGVLPEGLTPTLMYMNGTLRSWVHYCMLRMGNGTQLEHINIAQDCWNILKKEFPLVTEACEIVEQDTIKISRAEFNDLLYSRDFLEALKNNGVDNWEGYDYACSKFYGC